MVSGQSKISVYRKTKLGRGGNGVRGKIFLLKGKEFTKNNKIMHTQKQWERNTRLSGPAPERSCNEPTRRCGTQLGMQANAICDEGQ